MTSLYGGIEAGGTKFVCMIGNSPCDIKDEVQFPTTTPLETLKRAFDFFRYNESKFGRLSALGVGSFGPVDLNVQSSTYGFITNPPKPLWVNTNLLGIIKNEFDIPVFLDTDVNCATLGEFYWGSAQGLDSFVYLTIGTGVGGGAFVNGKLLHGAMHTEMGHMRIPHNLKDDPYKGNCPFHGDCLEGMISGPAISERWKISAKNLPDDHLAWNLVSKYLSTAIYNIICILSPKKIILGGGVMNRKQLFPRIREKVIELNNNYIQTLNYAGKIDNYIVAPGLGIRSGVLGAVALALANANDI